MFSVMFTSNLCYYLMEMQFNQSSNALLHPSSILLHLLLTCTWISYSKFEDLTSSTPIQTWQTPVKVQAQISFILLLFFASICKAHCNDIHDIVRIINSPKMLTYFHAHQMVKIGFMYDKCKLYCDWNRK